MPYEVGLTKRVAIADREQYINECCVGGDVIVERLLPTVRDRYGDVQTNQEDWGWFIWCRDGATKLAIDVTTDDADAGAFRIHLTSRVRRWLLFDTVTDTPALDGLCDLVRTALDGWAEGPPRVTRLDATYDPA